MKISFEASKEVMLAQLETTYERTQKEIDNLNEKIANLSSSIIVGPSQQLEVQRLKDYVDGHQYQLDRLSFRMSALKSSNDETVFCELDV